MVNLGRAIASFVGAANAVPAVQKVIRNDRATIILWADGKKTVVKCKEGEAQDDYAGFCACVVKRLYGSSKRAKRIMDGEESK